MFNLNTQNNNSSRRSFLSSLMRWGIFAGLGSFTLANLIKPVPKKSAWQINPHLCVQCGRCATACVLNPSAVKCIHSYEMCGYCELCFGYFQPGARELNEAAENQICPTGAIKRVFIEEPYYEYQIDRKLCIGCGKCVSGCNAFGNGSLHLQIDHALCQNCNECSIAKDCPSQAIIHIDSAKPYISREEPYAG